MAGVAMTLGFRHIFAIRVFWLDTRMRKLLM